MSSLLDIIEEGERAARGQSLDGEYEDLGVFASLTHRSGGFGG